MRTVVVSYLMLIMLLLGGCAAPWYRSDDFKAYYYGMQEASLASTGEQIETFYFIDDDVSESVETAIRETYCVDPDGITTERCINLTRTGSLGAEFLLDKKLVGYDPFVMLGNVAEIVKWLPDPDGKKNAEQFSCIYRPAIREMYLALGDSLAVYDPSVFLDTSWVYLFEAVPPSPDSIPDDDEPAKSYMTTQTHESGTEVYVVTIMSSTCRARLADMSCPL